ncbi:MAG: hypothetical protein I3274_04170 [Candidatus Moeniiplasma glomeromycotorum]|nr:hypothetical protein [Candidatus Moeniiplasma glomeromycotorum]MCE8167875.1 hypothetical protein [Candidatus Moeniiplasma glomeromycotorum]
MNQKQFLCQICQYNYWTLIIESEPLNVNYPHYSNQKNKYQVLKNTLKETPHSFSPMLLYM